MMPEEEKRDEFVELVRANLAKGNVSASNRKCSHCGELIPMFVEAQRQYGQPYFVDAIEHTCKASDVGLYEPGSGMAGGYGGVNLY